MRFPSFRVMALAGCAVALAVAGCASAVPSGRTTGMVSTSTAKTPRQQAVAEAAVIMKAFVPPPGAREVSGSPVPASPIDGAAPSIVPRDNDLVTRTSWWLVPGNAKQVLGWEAAHLPSPYRLTGTAAMAAGSWDDEFGLPAVAGLFDERWLGVATTAAGHGQVAIRVDALVDWIPVRPAGDTVPATARVATLTETPGNQAGTPVSRTVTVTDRAEVGRLAAYLNGLPANVPGAAYNCPEAFGGSLTVAFRARADGPVLARAKGELSGCAFVSYSVAGKASLGIGGPEAGGGLLAEVDRVAGLHWNASASQGRPLLSDFQSVIRAVAECDSQVFALHSAPGSAAFEWGAPHPGGVRSVLTRRLPHQGRQASESATARILNP